MEVEIGKIKVEFDLDEALEVANHLMEKLNTTYQLFLAKMEDQAAMQNISAMEDTLDTIASLTDTTIFEFVDHVYMAINNDTLSKRHTDAFTQAEQMIKDKKKELGIGFDGNHILDQMDELREKAVKNVLKDI